MSMVSYIRTACQPVTHCTCHLFAKGRGRKLFKGGDGGGGRFEWVFTKRLGLHYLVCMSSLTFLL